VEDNPYRAPVFSEPATEGEVVLTEAEIRAFVGRNSRYYLRKWPWSLDYFGRAKGFNWAAFLLSGLWMPYRKMYRLTLIFFAIIVAITVAEEIVVAAGFVAESAATVFDRVSQLVIPIICGIFANAWYLAHAKREIVKIRASGLKDEDYYQALARRGGTNLFASFGFFLLLIAALILLTFAAFSLFGLGDAG
jgi:hypothetical protein